MSTLDAAIRAKLHGDRAFRHEVDCLDCALDRDLGDAAIQAVLVVLGQHQPVSNEAWASSTPAIVCSCSPGEDDHYDQPYPCPTVRAIAEKLGVEVERG